MMMHGTMNTSYIDFPATIVHRIRHRRQNDWQSFVMVLFSICNFNYFYVDSTYAYTSSNWAKTTTNHLLKDHGDRWCNRFRTTSSSIQQSSARIRPGTSSLSYQFMPYNLQTQNRKPQSHTMQQIHMSALSAAVETSSGAASELHQLAEVNSVYGTRSELFYDANQDRYIRRPIQSDDNVSSSTSVKTANGDNITTIGRTSKRPNVVSRSLRKIQRLIKIAFVPAGVQDTYYPFMRWRIVQRFVNANLNVIGTQSLLLGLGIKSSSSQLGALSAALNWVLKDALGKLVRMLWAANMGLRFDSDARRWRMRSAFIYAAGNGCEIATYLFPHLFLVWATLANCCKQISMLTSSSTKSSIFNSFRDGTRENISDIYAKGEAQVAIVDLLGIGSGVTMSKVVIGTTASSIIIAYCVLQVMELICVYFQMRSIQYKVFNFERLITVLNKYLDDNRNGSSSSSNGDSIDSNLIENDPSQKNSASVATPKYMAKNERMLTPTKHLSRRQTAFGSLGRSKISPVELQTLISDVCVDERFLLVVGENMKRRRPWFRLLRPRTKQATKQAMLQENCHIVLHTDATNRDIVKGTLALCLLRRSLSSTTSPLSNTQQSPEMIRSENCYSQIRAAIAKADVLLPIILRDMVKQGWDSPARYMFGRVRRRAEWPMSSSK